MWAGTFQQYLDLYAVVAKAIKAHDPSLKVGGPATCCIWGVGAKPFLAFCRDHKDVPVDFLSWHCYGDVPNFLRDSTVAARKLLGEYGFKDLECLVTEWHPMWYGWGDGPSGSWQEGYLGCFDEMGNPTPKKWATMREKFDRMRGPEAAAFAASALMLAQDSPPDMACYYTADTQCFGMFDLFGGPGRVYYAFVAFNQLTKTPNRVACKRQGDAQPAACRWAPVSSPWAAFADDNWIGEGFISALGAAPQHNYHGIVDFPTARVNFVNTQWGHLNNWLTEMATSAAQDRDQTAGWNGKMISPPKDGKPGRWTLPRWKDYEHVAGLGLLHDMWDAGGNDVPLAWWWLQEIKRMMHWDDNVQFIGYWELADAPQGGRRRARKDRLFGLLPSRGAEAI